MSALALLNSCPDPGEQQIIDAMQGNICRCGTYLRIVRAIRQAGTAMQSAASHAGKWRARYDP
jgi:aerobic-type carbon monoxide dehydrogenase small subunit (CoxS/CutS family)